MCKVKFLIMLAAALPGWAMAQPTADLGKVKMGAAIGTEDDMKTAPVPAGEGNLQAGFYPKSPCAKPDKQSMGRPPEESNQAAMQSYNAKVKAFNQNAVTFNACMKTYVDRAQNDVKAIQQTVHAAVADANLH